MYREAMVTFLVFTSAVLLLVGLVLSGVALGRLSQEREIIERCKETGMFLSSGYALNCRVLTNEGYFPRKG